MEASSGRKVLAQLQNGRFQDIFDLLAAAGEPNSGGGFCRSSVTTHLVEQALLRSSRASMDDLIVSALVRMATSICCACLCKAARLS
jgi:hypothetical protein